MSLQAVVIAPQRSKHMTRPAIPSSHLSLFPIPHSCASLTEDAKGKQFSTFIRGSQKYNSMSPMAIHHSLSPWICFSVYLDFMNYSPLTDEMQFQPTFKSCVMRMLYPEVLDLHSHPSHITTPHSRGKSVEAVGVKKADEGPSGKTADCTRSGEWAKMQCCY